tara:strand:- start:111 stop:482 length:372 start_codon:yes stop_codon:yes gene_type:complete
MERKNAKKTTTIFSDGSKAWHFDLIEVDELGNHILYNRRTGKVIQYCQEVKEVKIQVTDKIWVHQERNGGTYGCEFERNVTRTGKAYRKASDGTVGIECRVKEDGGYAWASYDIKIHGQFIAV